MDTSENDTDNFPSQITEKYTISKLLGRCDFAVNTDTSCARQINFRVYCWRGACGEVRLIFEKGSCKQFAVKIVSKKKFSVGGKHVTVSVTSMYLYFLKWLSRNIFCLTEFRRSSHEWSRYLEVFKTCNDIFVYLKFVTFSVYYLSFVWFRYRFISALHSSYCWGDKQRRHLVYCSWVVRISF